MWRPHQGDDVRSLINHHALAGRVAPGRCFGRCLGLAVHRAAFCPRGGGVVASAAAKQAARMADGRGGWKGGRVAGEDGWEGGGDGGEGGGSRESVARVRL